MSVMQKLFITRQEYRLINDHFCELREGLEVGVGERDGIGGEQGNCVRRDGEGKEGWVRKESKEWL